MIKNIFMCLSLGAITQAPAMEPICYLTRIPAEVQNLIAYFLYETHEELAARTIAILNKSFKQSFYSKPEHPRFEYCSFRNIPLNDEYHNHGLYVYSPDKTKIAYLDQQAALIVLDLKKGNKEEVIYKKKLDLRYTEKILHPTQIAISEDAQLIAIAGEEHDYKDNRDDYLNIKSIIEIQTLAKNLQKNLSVPTHFRCLLLAFNKQNTHLVAYGTPHNFKDNKRIIVKIFPFTTKENIIEFDLEEFSNQETVIAKAPLKKPTLKKHFKLQYICNNLKSLMHN